MPETQSSGRAAKSRLVFLYHAIPDKGFFHLPFIPFKALLCVSSPPATISFKCLSCAFITSSAAFPWSGKSHGPPNCLHVIVFISLASFHSIRPSVGTNANDGTELPIGSARACDPAFPGIEFEDRASINSKACPALRGSTANLDSGVDGAAAAEDPPEVVTIVEAREKVVRWIRAEKCTQRTPTLGH